MNPWSIRNVRRSPSCLLKTSLQKTSEQQPDVLTIGVNIASQKIIHSVEQPLTEFQTSALKNNDRITITVQGPGRSA